MQPEATTETAATSTDINTLILEAISHCRDTSLRDGVQSWDANRWRLPHLLPVAYTINDLAKTVAEQGGHFNPVEAWGGGQVMQPAKFLQEDPFYNLAQLHEAMPDVRIQALHRGPQGFGFAPTSYEVLKETLRQSAHLGLDTIRDFDMMNDPNNLTISNKIVKDLAAEGVTLNKEGAISYINEPADPNDFKHRAMTFGEYADLALEMAKQGDTAIAIKNYSGAGNEDMVPLIETIRAKLDAARLEGSLDHDVAVNLHTHGNKPELLYDALKAGASIVDVGIGELSGGPAHTDMRSFIYTYLEKNGVDVKASETEINAHPVIQSIMHVEKAIDAELDKQVTAKGASLKESRPPELSQEKIDEYHMAAGALSDLWTQILTQSQNNQYHVGKMHLVPQMNEQPAAEQIYDYTLHRAKDLWEMAGRPNTVTPGAKIISEMATKLTMQEFMELPEKLDHLPKDNMRAVEDFPLSAFSEDYLNIVKGRFGTNRGLQTEGKEVGNRTFRDAALMGEALEILNAKAPTLPNKTEVQNFFLDALDAPKTQIMRRSAKAESVPEDTGRFTYKNDLDLKKLDTLNLLKKANIDKFRSAVENAPIQQDVKDAMVKVLQPGKINAPKQDLDMGKRFVIAMKMRLPFTNHEAKPEEGLQAETLNLLPVVLGQETALKIFEKVSETDLAKDSRDKLLSQFNMREKNTFAKAA